MYWKVLNEENHRSTHLKITAKKFPESKSPRSVLTIKEVENGTADKTDNVLLNSPHPEYAIVSDEWNHSYSRAKAAYPTNWVAENKFWVNVARVDNAFGDRNLMCTCRPTTDWL